MQKIQIYYNCLTEFSKFLRLSKYILYRNKIEKASFREHKNRINATMKVL